MTRVIARGAPSDSTALKFDRSSTPVALAVVAAIACAALYDMSSVGQLTNFAITCFALAAVLVVMESIRAVVGSRNAPWWLTYGPLLAWAGLVILPWFLRRGQLWSVGAEGAVDSELSRSWVINLTAMFGFAIAGAYASLPRVSARTWRQPPVTVVRSIVGPYFVLLTVYLLSFPATGKPIAALWRLNSDIRYSDRVGQSIGYFDLIPNVLVALVLADAAARRYCGKTRPPPLEVLLLLVTILLALGDATRFRVLLLIVGWFAIQAGQSDHRTFGVRLTRVVAGLLLVVALPLGVGAVSYLRAGLAVESWSDILRVATNSLDVIGAQELVVQRGATAGMLEGGNLTQLPSQLLPSRVLPGPKALPEAQSIVNTYLDPRGGFSAPYWFEWWLSFGLWGVFGVCALLGGLYLSLLRSVVSRGGPKAQMLIGLNWVPLLCAYQLLSRLLTTQFIATMVSLGFGFWLGSRSLRAGGRAPRERHAALGPPVVTS